MRYAALREMARQAGAQQIVTGHTADDQAETVLMRIIRGTGLAGLAGIPAKRGAIVRPLLRIWRREIIAYLRERKLTYRIDLSNTAPDLTRNRIRLELLPMLEREYDSFREIWEQFGKIQIKDEDQTKGDDSE